MSILSLLVLLLCLACGYITAWFVPEELAPGKKWFWVALVFFVVLGIVFFILSGLSVQTLCAAAGTLFVIGTILKARKH